MKPYAIIFAAASLGFLPTLAEAQWTGINPVLTMTPAASVGIGLSAGSTPSAKLQIQDGDLHLTTTNNSGSSSVKTISTNSDQSILSLTTKGAGGVNTGPSVDLYGSGNGWRQGNIYFIARTNEQAPSFGQCFTFQNYNAADNSWTPMMTMMQQWGKSKVVIGAGISANGDYGLYVERGIMTERLKVAVKTSADWSDFVFKPDYELRTLSNLRSFIKENGHLPDIPSAEDVVKEGVDVGQMNAMLLRKVEELTLYVLDLQGQIEEIKKAPFPKKSSNVRP